MVFQIFHLIIVSWKDEEKSLFWQILANNNNIYDGIALLLENTKNCHENMFQKHGRKYHLYII